MTFAPPARACAALLALLAPAASLAAGAGTANLTWEEARARAARVSGVDDVLHPALREKSPDYDGGTRVTFTLAPGGGAPLFLDFQGRTVRRLAVNGTEVASPRHEAHRLYLPEDLMKPGPNVVDVRYTNRYDNDGAGLHKVVDPADGHEYLYTQFEPFDANRVFPCFDQPDLKATYSTHVQAPEAWQVVTNGAETGRDPDGTRHFATTKRFSPYIVALAAGPYVVYEDEEARLPSRIFVTRSMAPHADPEDIFEVTRQGLDFFEGYFELEYPFGKYDQVFVPGFNWGAMENVGCVIFSGDAFLYRHEPTAAELGRRANVVLHEMAHMWFGDIVTMQWWNDIWLNESFATYMAHLAQARATKYDDAWETFSRRTKGWAYWQDQLPTTHPIETKVPDTRTVFTNFDGITYGKGASTLKQLAFFVGEEAFRKGVAAYLAEHAWGNATRADFVAAIGEAAGMDLDEWVRVWLQRSGVNTITPELEVDGRGRIRRLVLRQGRGNGAGLLRPHRLVLGLYDQEPGGQVVLRETLPVTVRGERTAVPELVGKAAPDFLHANHGDHAFAKVFLDPASLAFARRHLGDLPGSWIRSVVWQTLWFMVRDGAAAPEAYLDLALREAAAEADAKVLQSILENVASALDHYLGDGAEAAYRKRFRDLAGQRVRAAPAGSDLQKAWFGALVTHSRERVDALRLRRMLAGHLEIPGLELDQEKRWSLVQQLCALGAPRSTRLLAAERSRDSTDRGLKAAYRAEVSQPDAAVKAAAWERFVHDRETPLSQLRAGMRGFWWRHQLELLGPYAERYFEDLPAAIADRSPYAAEAFAGRLFPGKVVSRAALARARAFLADPGVELGPLTKTLRNETDELRRAVAIRTRTPEEETR